MLEKSDLAPTPLVKWVGGKRQLQAAIIPRILEVFDPRNGSYFEPFFGGGAIYFALGPSKAFASDLNSGLVNLYNSVTNFPDGVVEALRELQNEYNILDAKGQQALYYAKREEFNSLDSSQRFPAREGLLGAALFLFLNKAGFNGMYRENRNGAFNIPFGKRERINLFEDGNLELASQSLRNLTVSCQDYRKTVEHATPGDFVYFDPPYAPLSKTSSFEGYNSENLDGFNQEELRDLVIDLTKRGVHCLVSNSSAPIIEELYKDFNMAPLAASRAISASAAGRKKVKEYLIDNFQHIRR
jgi:DNA adenine methylase